LQAALDQRAKASVDPAVCFRGCVEQELVAIPLADAQRRKPKIECAVADRLAKMLAQLGPGLWLLRRSVQGKTVSSVAEKVLG
jgi:hypothetical protein